MSDRHGSGAPTQGELLPPASRGWGSPVGLGLFVLQLVGLSWLVADGLSILSAI